MGDLEPLDPVLWFERIEKIANGEFGLENSLRHVFHLLQLAPLPLRHTVRLAIDEESFESLLADGHYDAAARHLVAQPTALSVVQTLHGRFVTAAISCAIPNRVIRGTGRSEAAAILDAWTSSMLALRNRCGANLTVLRRQRLHSTRPPAGL